MKVKSGHLTSEEWDMIEEKQSTDYPRVRPIVLDLG